MRIDFEDLQLYSKIHHTDFEKFIQQSHGNNIEYFTSVNDFMWAIKSSPYHIFDIAWTRSTGVYEVFYDYIKRQTPRGATIFDYGAGLGTLELQLLKRFPGALSVYEPNLICLDFIFWRLNRRGAEPSPRLEQYDIVISLDFIQRLPLTDVEETLNFLATLGKRLFLFVPQENHPLYCKLPVNIETFFKPVAVEMTYFHGLWDITLEREE